MVRPDADAAAADMAGRAASTAIGSLGRAPQPATPANVVIANALIANGRNRGLPPDGLLSLSIRSVVRLRFNLGTLACQKRASVSKVEQKCLQAIGQRAWKQRCMLLQITPFDTHR